MWLYRAIKRERSLRSYMLRMLVSVNVIIILLLPMGAYSFYRDSFIQEIAAARADVSRQISERTRQFKTDLYTLSNLYCNDMNFISYASQLSPDTLDAFTQYMDRLTTQLENSFDSLNLEFYVVYQSSQGLGYCSRAVPEDYDYMNPTTRLWYRDIHQAQGSIVDVVGYKDTALNIRVFSAARAVKNSQGDTVGYLMINADERQLYQMYSDVVTNIHSEIYVTNQKGQMVSSSLEKIVGFSYFNMDNLDAMFDGGEFILVDIAGKEALFTRYYDENSQFTVFEEIPLSDLTQPLQNVRNATILFSLLVLCVAILFALHFAKRVTSPIQALCLGVQEVEHGDLDYIFGENGYREIHSLSDGMNNMLRQIQILIQRVQHKEEQKKQMEINWLQAQINPHFMYNTLFSIKCMVEMGNHNDAIRMLSSFIHLLRGVLSTSQDMVTVQDQLDWLQEYIQLQKIRYDNTFDVLIECDPTAASCSIPKLLIQPLVENSIQHGLDVQRQDGFISVVVRHVDQAILILVEDNGKGMTQEQIQQIMAQQEGHGRPHIGIKNIHDRIQLVYGKPWGVEIESTPGVGTRITLRIPAVATPPHPSKEVVC